jgi:hypothetical protein
VKWLWPVLHSTRTYTVLSHEFLNVTFWLMPAL